MNAISAFLLGAAMMACFAGSASADALRCAGHLVTEGDSAARVINACGPPSFRDPWRGQEPPGFGSSMTEWTYNRGPHRLLEQVVFRDGRVVAIYSGGYGVIEHDIPPSGSCEPNFIRPGLSKFRLLLACGRPVQKTGWFINSRVFREGGHTYLLGHSVRRVYRERWIYNFGPNRLLREITLNNARVTSIKRLERGFDAR